MSIPNALNNSINMRTNPSNKNPSKSSNNLVTEKPCKPSLYSNKEDCLKQPNYKVQNLSLENESILNLFLMSLKNTQKLQNNKKRNNRKLLNLFSVKVGYDDNKLVNDSDGNKNYDLTKRKSKKKEAGYNKFNNKKHLVSTSEMEESIQNDDSFYNKDSRKRLNSNNIFVGSSNIEAVDKRNHNTPKESNFSDNKNKFDFTYEIENKKKAVLEGNEEAEIIQNLLNKSDEDNEKYDNYNNNLVNENEDEFNKLNKDNQCINNDPQNYNNNLSHKVNDENSFLNNQVHFSSLIKKESNNSINKINTNKKINNIITNVNDSTYSNINRIETNNNYGSIDEIDNEYSYLNKRYDFSSNISFSYFSYNSDTSIYSFNNSEKNFNKNNILDKRRNKYTFNNYSNAKNFHISKEYKKNYIDSSFAVHQESIPDRQNSKIANSPDNSLFNKYRNKRYKFNYYSQEKLNRRTISVNRIKQVKERSKVIKHKFASKQAQNKFFKKEDKPICFQNPHVVDKGEKWNNKNNFSTITSNNKSSLVNISVMNDSSIEKKNFINQMQEDEVNYKKDDVINDYKDFCRIQEENKEADNLEMNNKNESNNNNSFIKNRNTSNINSSYINTTLQKAKDTLNSHFPQSQVNNLPHDTKELSNKRILLSNKMIEESKENSEDTSKENSIIISNKINRETEKLEKSSIESIQKISHENTNISNNTSTKINFLSENTFNQRHNSKQSSISSLNNNDIKKPSTKLLGFKNTNEEKENKNALDADKLNNNLMNNFNYKEDKYSESKNPELNINTPNNKIFQITSNVNNVCNISNNEITYNSFRHNNKSIKPFSSINNKMHSNKNTSNIPHKENLNTSIINSQDLLINQNKQKPRQIKLDLLNNFNNLSNNNSNQNTTQNKNNLYSSSFPSIFSFNNSNPTTTKNTKLTKQNILSKFNMLFSNPNTPKNKVINFGNNSNTNSNYVLNNKNKINYNYLNYMNNNQSNDNDNNDSEAFKDYKILSNAEFNKIVNEQLHNKLYLKAVNENSEFLVYDQDEVYDDSSSMGKDSNNDYIMYSLDKKNRIIYLKSNSLISEITSMFQSKITSNKMTNNISGEQSNILTPKGREISNDNSLTCNSINSKNSSNINNDLNNHHSLYNIYENKNKSIKENRKNTKASKTSDLIKITTNKEPIKNDKQDNSSKTLSLNKNENMNNQSQEDSIFSIHQNDSSNQAIKNKETQNPEINKPEQLNEESEKTKFNNNNNHNHSNQSNLYFDRDIIIQKLKEIEIMRESQNNNNMNRTSSNHNVTANFTDNN